MYHECGLILVEKCMYIPGKDAVSKLLEDLCVLFFTFTEVEVSFAKGTDQPKTITEPGFWTDSSNHKTHFHCVMVHPRCL